MFFSAPQNSQQQEPPVFEFHPTGDSFLEIYYDECPEGNASEDLDGTGYNDGTLILRASIASAQSVSFQPDGSVELRDMSNFTRCGPTQPAGDIFILTDEFTAPEDTVPIIFSTPGDRDVVANLIIDEYFFDNIQIEGVLVGKIPDPVTGASAQLTVEPDKGFVTYYQAKLSAPPDFGTDRLYFHGLE